jgi:rare lipoprotein A
MKKKYLFLFVLFLSVFVPYQLQAQGADVFKQEGIASWYGREFEGRPTASGEIFDSSDMTAAHPSLPFGTKLVVTNQHNNKSVIVRVNDRGPFVPARIIDVSRAAAEQLDMIVTGTAPVTVQSIDRIVISSPILETQMAVPLIAAPSVIPVVTAPVQTAPNQAVPVLVTPAQNVPVTSNQITPAQNEFVHTAPVQTTPNQTVPVPVQVTPAQNVPVTSNQITPVHTTPIQTIPVTSAPVQTTPALTVPETPSPTPIFVYQPVVLQTPNYQIKVTPEIDIISTKNYRLQVGSYKVAKNAVDAFDRLKASGLSPNYERFINSDNVEYYRVIVAGVRGDNVQYTTERIGAAGFKEAIIKEEN